MADQNAFNPLAALLRGDNARNTLLSNKRGRELDTLQQRLATEGGGLDNPITNQIAAVAPAQGAQLIDNFRNLPTGRQEAFVTDARQASRFIRAGQPQRALDLAVNRKETLTKIDPAADSADTDFAIQVITEGIQTGDFTKALEAFDQAAGMDLLKIRGQFKSAAQRQFENLTSDLTPEEKREATLIELGLSPRAVGSASQTIAGNDLTDLVADSQATIKGRIRFAEKTGASRAKTIDDGFSRIQKIDAANLNIDRAISALTSGAGVGAVEKFFPSFKAASVELDNIQKSMALDVVGAVTFGALSKGELDLAKEVALPTGLNTTQLLDYLTRRKSAQSKLRNYFSDQIQFLDQGGTIAGFMREQERTNDDSSNDPEINLAPQSLQSEALGREISEEDISDTLAANPGMTREQLLQQLGVR